MGTSFVAALMALAALGFLELFGRIYPARALWWRLRRSGGRETVRRMRERYEGAAARRTPLLLALVVLLLIATWAATSSLLDKRWYEVVTDLLPAAIVIVALLRTRPALRLVAERMKGYEREAGDEPDAPLEGGGPPALAL
jgi:hypothetical protein